MVMSPERAYDGWFGQCSIVFSFFSKRNQTEIDPWHLTSKLWPLTLAVPADVLLCFSETSVDLSQLTPDQRVLYLQHGAHHLHTHTHKNNTTQGFLVVDTTGFIHTQHTQPITQIYFGHFTKPFGLKLNHWIGYVDICQNVVTKWILWQHRKIYKNDKSTLTNQM